MFDRIGLAAAAFLLLTPAAHAQEDTQAARLAMAQEYIDMTLGEMSGESMAEAAAGPVVRQIRLTDPTVTEDQIRRIELLVGAEMAAINQEIVATTAPDLAAIMTLDELTALRDFYASDLGRSVMLKMPQYLRAYQPRVMEAMNARYNAMNAGIIDILNDDE
ncbi:hypothetical protein FHS89_002143 [Rubricella aquisinus]|uniref:DUF2059 domain-containing protein n=1 Tax=Rubricella aquisinus TaxID=2028108 RepID=A0A840X5X9_9RHOB|nr:DUF2059 domain-containing protein [Rubricella aquisinus]MBB5516117.1 hypothetical protein [Rubricella aquisinus]